MAVLELAIGIAIVLSFRPLVYLNQLTSEMAPTLSRVMPEYLVYPIAGSLLAIFPTALLMGVAFPIGLQLWASRTGRTAERAGLFYSLNVGGAIVGSLAGGFLLLPRFGSETSLVLLGAVSFAGGVALLAVATASTISRAGDRRRRRRGIRLGDLVVAGSVRAVHGAALPRHRPAVEGRRG